MTGSRVFPGVLVQPFNPGAPRGSSGATIQHDIRQSRLERSRFRRCSSTEMLVQKRTHPRWFEIAACVAQLRGARTHPSLRADSISRKAIGSPALGGSIAHAVSQALCEVLNVYFWVRLRTSTRLAGGHLFHELIIQYPALALRAKWP